jgi:hypothetical protein
MVTFLVISQYKVSETKNITQIKKLKHGDLILKLGSKIRTVSTLQQYLHIPSTVMIIKRTISTKKLTGRLHTVYNLVIYLILLPQYPIFKHVNNTCF